ncbi:Bifunctional NAD(P)H-hydrate repair enzyme Nnr [Botrimarina colliarenosi]|uniref:NAD(P)H-hydrate epimerase n=2 Tax=Botrimarina colliarenosi TaxID=2528001 RepID=A0A5C6ALF7_9BACT|nr:Bifunctional NAD(P)H-hydrate repair enzyme Nnr [Botrimarina colliarenosi]
MNREEVRAFDRDAIERLGLPGVVLMENAGRGCVEVLERLGVGGPVLVVCGKGNNGGDGFVIARHLAVRGYDCRVALGADPADLAGDARVMFEALTHCGVPILDESGVNAGLMLQELDALSRDAAWIVDALLGTGVKGSPRPPYDTLIDWMNGEGGRRLAVDLPSGLDCDTGEPGSPTVRADHTCTFVAPKVGFANPAAAEFLGELHVLDIGAPFNR